MRIEGSVAVVTGANRGLGLALVEQLLARGAKRIYAGARDPSKLRDVVSSSGGRVVALSIDLADPDSIAAAAKTAKDATLLINNAGALEFGSQVSADLAGIRRDFETNYFLAVTSLCAP
jgi:NAD(P)-dependent dehydrogenase (short-subunit alcohol dehydrogenase family)